MTDVPTHGRPSTTPPSGLVSRVLERITTEHIHPRPRLAFVFENWFFWSLGALSVGLGAVAFSAGVFEVENVPWLLYPATHSDFISFFFDAAPTLFVVALTLFIALGYVNIRRTKRGYRYPLAVIALGAVLTSISFGSAFYAAGVGEAVEQALGDHPPFYRPILVRERAWWLEPGKGLLGGVVQSATPDRSVFVLKDFSGRTWAIDGSELSDNSGTAVARGGAVRVVGVSTTTGETGFHACFVFAWPEALKRSLPPVAVIYASSTAINGARARTEICKGLGPYEELRAVDEQGLF